VFDGTSRGDGVTNSRLALFIVATSFGVSSTIQAFWLERLAGIPATSMLALHLLLLNLVYWYVVALFAPLVIALALRFEASRIAWPRQALLHIAGAFTYSVVHTAAMLATRALLFPEEVHQGVAAASWWKYAQKQYLTQLDWLIMTYLFLVGVAHALAYRRESEERAIGAAQLETRLVEAQLQALQRQLHPHFLFNTLNTIAALMRTDVTAADLMIEQLADLLRMTLNTSGTQEVTLQEELEVLQKYVEIEQTRFGARLRVTMRIDPDTLEAQVPTLLLQPLVENAVRHGVSPYARPGWITLHTTLRREQLTIEICDSGDGLPPDRLTALNRGIGLTNTRARLEHLYRKEHQLVFSNVEKGFCVTVTIPHKLEPRPARATHVGAA
jgi:LytS/YehU family sensor histidine kinase